MPQMLGIKPDTPRQSPLNTYFVSDGVEWTVWQSETGDTLRIIKGENLTFVPFQRAWNVELVLFGPSFLSTFHTISEHVVKCVHMTTNARVYNILLQTIMGKNSFLQSHAMVIYYTF